MTWYRIGLIFLLVAVCSGSKSNLNSAVCSLTLKNATGTYLVTVRRNRSDYSLEIIRNDQGKETRIAEYLNVGFLYARPYNTTSDRLISVWETGTTLTVTVFRLGASGVNSPILFEDNTENDPEFIHGRRSDFMVLFEGRQFEPGNTHMPTKALIYQWNGLKCKLFKSVPFDRRFQALAVSVAE